ncbi:MAG: hypothetical protein HC837_00510 [Chloroflexaceae bacterium]|nr:hypothetical protein [Chloroflexaceae bacterium]
MPLARSLSHGWGGSPTWFLTTYVLGAQMTGPQSWRVAPQPGSLRSASGQRPLPAGPLEVAWSRPDCGAFTLTVQTPDSPALQGEIVLPAGQPLRVLLNGEMLWSARERQNQRVQLTDEGLVIGDVTAGRYTITSEYACAATVYLPIVRRK